MQFASVNSPDAAAPAASPEWYEMDPEDLKPRRRTTRRSVCIAKTADRRGGQGDGRRKELPRSALQGLWGEEKAEKWLVKNAGLVPVGRRVKVGRDEIDIVMKVPGAGGEPEQIVFVEVKTRSSDLFGGGLAAVDRRKRHALGRAASRWMLRNADCPMRIDVVEVYGDSSCDRVDRIFHQEAAVPLEKRINAHALGNGRASAKIR